MNIEELAFKDRITLAQLNELVLLDIIEFLQKDRQQWINQFSKTHNESVEIQAKNKKLNGAIQTYDILLKANVEENKQLKEAIKKAVLELANIDGNLSNSQLSDRICNLIDILKEVLE